MSRIIPLILLGLLCQDCLAQTNNEPAQLRKNAITALRTFRDSLSKVEDTGQSDSLQKATNLLLSYVKSESDTFQLNALNEYYTKAMYFLKNASADEKGAVVNNLNQDIQLKFSMIKDNGNLYLGPETPIFKNCEVNVSALVNGSKDWTGKFVLFWAQFTGVDQKTIISSGAFNGNSTAFSNPYKLSIKLPGYIIFWLEDATTRELYRGVPDYNRMLGNERDIQVNFIPLK
ncbi:hypothetical protein [Chitinophaga ginsengisoli]|uniref:GLPGLI family protein n=1 Tax=Chitinophaga ginsengisoli TaxID=363837 RepID=A0A2P8G9Q1_9BACT|nr:hypothetical protein [Chitinophaga ginsengisoli]PSL30697.1 hypothetical protein CLV42_10558 [Chitinophaga ginsengisoli]